MTQEFLKICLLVGFHFYLILMIFLFVSKTTIRVKIAIFTVGACIFAIIFLGFHSVFHKLGIKTNVLGNHLYAILPYSIIISFITLLHERRKIRKKQ